MSEQLQKFPGGWWAEILDPIDREIARMATLCEVRILDHQVMKRVLQQDDSVCGRPNPIAFAKLRNLLMMHFAVRQKSVDSVGQAQTVAIEDYIIERLRKSFPDLPGQWPPA